MKRSLFPIIIKYVDGVYTAFSPDIKAVHFSDADRQHAIDLAKGGVDLYVKLHPEMHDVSNVTVVMV